MNYLPVVQRLHIVSRVSKQWRRAALRSINALKLIAPSLDQNAISLFPGLTDLTLRVSGDSTIVAPLQLPTSIRRLQLKLGPNRADVDDSLFFRFEAPLPVLSQFITWDISEIFPLLEASTTSLSYLHLRLPDELSRTLSALFRALYLPNLTDFALLVQRIFSDNDSMVSVYGVMDDLISHHSSTLTALSITRTNLYSSYGSNRWLSGDYPKLRSLYLRNFFWGTEPMAALLGRTPSLTEISLDGLSSMSYELQLLSAAPSSCVVDLHLDKYQHPASFPSHLPGRIRVSQLRLRNEWGEKHLNDLITDFAQCGQASNVSKLELVGTYGPLTSDALRVFSSLTFLEFTNMGSHVYDNIVLAPLPHLVRVKFNAGGSPPLTQARFFDRLAEVAPCLVKAEWIKSNAPLFSNKEFIEALSRVLERRRGISLVRIVLRKPDPEARRTVQRLRRKWATHVALSVADE